MVAISAVSPEIVDPDLLIELATATTMIRGRVAGGFELFPGSVVQFSPQTGGLVDPSAKPLKLGGAEPPLIGLSFHH
jgi:hypothetical protein